MIGGIVRFQDFRTIFDTALRPLPVVSGVDIVTQIKRTGLMQHVPTCLVHTPVMIGQVINPPVLDPDCFNKWGHRLSVSFRYTRLSNHFGT